MRRVVLESPYAGLVERNVAYARMAVLDCLLNFDECPFASHLLYTQSILNDKDEAERKLGMRAGLDWATQAAATVVYDDLGTSSGVERGIDHAKMFGRPIEYRQLPDSLLLRFAELALMCGQLKDLPTRTRNRLIKLNFTSVEPGPV